MGGYLKKCKARDNSIDLALFMRQLPHLSFSTSTATAFTLSASVMTAAGTGVGTISAAGAGVGMAAVPGAGIGVISVGVLHAVSKMLYQIQGTIPGDIIVDDCACRDRNDIFLIFICKLKSQRYVALFLQFLDHSVR